MATMNSECFRMIIPNSSCDELIVPDPVEEFGHKNCRRLTLRSSRRVQKKCITRKKRSLPMVYTIDQRNALEVAFLTSKYLNKKMKDDLSSELGLEVKAVQKWYQNRRNKYRKCNKCPPRVKLEETVCNTISENIIQEYDGHCPTCLQPAHVRHYEDGRWIYCMRNNADDINEDPKHNDEQNKDWHQVLQADSDRSPRYDVNERTSEQKKSEEEYHSDDFDSLLDEVEKMCKYEN